MALSDYPNLSGERAKLICLDIADGVQPRSSERLEYGPEDLAFRKDALADARSMSHGVAFDVRD
jgi:hypothetical protein